MSSAEEPWCPLSIMLSMYGSRISSKLLYRYPFNRLQPDPQPLSSYRQLTSSTFHLNKHQISSLSDDSEDNNKSPRDEIEQLESFSDELLGNILSPRNTKICGKKFDLKVNGIRFVGFPLVVEQMSSIVSKYEILRKYAQESEEHDDCISNAGKAEVDSTLLSFSIVFVLRGVAEYSIVEKYQELGLKLGIALQFEEKCSQYLTEETRLILSIHDEVSLESEDVATPECTYRTILEKSHLADQISNIFNNLSKTGIVSVRVNESTLVNFCLPQKVHNMATDGQGTISVKTLETAIKEIRPYHGILIFEKREIWSTLPDDYSPALTRLLVVYEPRKSLQSLASDADLPLTQVYLLASQLVYWGKAGVIYPLCDSNIYVIAPNAKLDLHSESARSFNMRFSLDMIKVLSHFSLPARLSDMHQSPHGFFYSNEENLIQVIFWLLQRRFLIQMHTYIFFSPSDSSDPQLPVYEKILHTRERAIGSEFSSILASLPSGHKRAIFDIPASKNQNDLRLFLNLLKYFNGECHMEEIMYNENLSRTQLLKLLDKFSPVLLTNLREDNTTAAFCLEN